MQPIINPAAVWLIRDLYLYRLFVGALILAIVLPVQPSGYQPLWPVVARVPYEPGAWRNKASPP